MKVRNKEKKEMKKGNEKYLFDNSTTPF